MSNNKIYMVRLISGCRWELNDNKVIFTSHCDKEAKKYARDQFIVLFDKMLHQERFFIIVTEMNLGVVEREPEIWNSLPKTL